MRIARDMSSPWGQRVWFNDADFEAMMDELLKKAGGDAFVSGSGVDVDLILHRIHKVTPDFVDLPSGTLGRTRFFADGRIDVEVDRTLAAEAEESRVGRRRLRSTLAHEVGHIACHGHLYVVDQMTPSLFGAEPTPAPQVLCRAAAIAPDLRSARYEGDWWEYQANRCMGALLVPRGMLLTSLDELLASRGATSFAAALKTEAGESIVRDLSDRFDVSLQLMFYRLQGFGMIPKDERQESLGLLEQ